MNIKLLIAYLGTSYLGWQKTPMGPSIEEALEKALSIVLQEEKKLQAASRTDAGVHAQGQVVNFTLSSFKDLKRLKASLNGCLPKDIVVLSAQEMPESFHPTLDAIKKEYIYEICNSTVQLPFHRNTSWHFPYPLKLRL